MNDPVSPIFIVGSPRSGTSILTWCLGQHPNILPIEESNWMGKLAFDVASCHIVGSARGLNSHLGSMGISVEMLLEEFGNTIHRLTLAGREKLDGYYAEALVVDPIAAKRMFRVSRDKSHPKRRWVDGTPEYSLFIQPLLKLFPGAKFIHLIRDVKSVVRSLLNFPTTGGTPVVNSEQAAYEYWLRTVRSCVEAERAYGSGVVMRVRYEHLVAQPRLALDRCLTFLGESSCPDCLEPLQTKINSSNVVDGEKLDDPQTDPAVREEAEQLNAELLSEASQTYDPDPTTASRMEYAFVRRAQYCARMQLNVAAALRRAASAERELQQLRGAHLPERLRAVVTACTEYNSIVAVVSNGDETILDLAGRYAWHFPCDKKGAYAGSLPDNSAEAIDHIETVRSRGADYLLVPECSLWWLEHFKEFAEHLDGRYSRVWARNDTAVLFKLNGTSI